MTFECPFQPKAFCDSKVNWHPERHTGGSMWSLSSRELDIKPVVWWGCDSMGNICSFFLSRWAWWLLDWVSALLLELDHLTSLFWQQGTKAVDFFTRIKIMPFSKHINIGLRRFSISTAQVCNILCAQILMSEVPGVLLPPFSCHWQRWGRELWIHRFLSKKPEALCSTFVGQHAFKIFL